MKKYYVINHTKSVGTDVIRKDTMEMYHFSSINVESSGKTNLLLCVIVLGLVVFPWILLRIAPKFQIISIILAALVLFFALVPTYMAKMKKTVLWLDSYPMEKKRFVPTKKYLKNLKGEQVKNIFLFIFLLAICVLGFLFDFFNLGMILNSSDYYWAGIETLVFMPVFIYFILLLLISCFSNYLALRNYEKINEDKLRFDGPVIYPEYSPDRFSSYDAMPLYDVLGEQLFDKCNIGYRIEDVDAFLGALRKDLLNGCYIPAERVRKVVFHKAPLLKTAYSVPEVDAALEYIEKRIAKENKQSRP